ncbi:Qat anti-phage system QueC-like protein QatC [Sinorhizobium meliloti]|uniref:Qat anti-phage system QueC-like protein QatC n=1 Tax=Rhizobium meliloti TaxID=382 RepID=UPI000B49ABC3|nr:Qat anti-phage system QueC-like protein QatC [Sinorhizobium meliloti]ASP68621.1 hypothetical protein CDO29_29915 [Sinorhizobium meliloti]MQX04585.1 hypothetical protein [Sinorhizobium meliloti]RVE96434.1 hypothetical protein CN234_35990 [Sinorhizobium meliloti]RVK41465.1 hypothetical protein CN160_32955 [Sinorhizobium meliloti]
MTRYVLSPRLGVTDGFSATKRGDEEVLAFDILRPDLALGLSIDDAIKQLKNANATPSSVGLEMLLLSALVYLADTQINRVQASQDGWTREIGLHLPVGDIDLWNGVKCTLETMLRFLTGDLWSVDFRPWPAKVATGLSSQTDLLRPTFKGISLFSGGLDSLIGAIDHLKMGREEMLFVSHRADGSISKPQSDLFGRVKEQYPDQAVKRLAFGNPRVETKFEGLRSENSTRGRSFLFIGLAAFAGSALSEPFPIIVPENGLISLNVPLDPTRLGSNSTRTTHPYYFRRWNDLLRKLGIQGTVQNPYWNKTKGEMVLECQDVSFLKQVASISLSCAHPAHDRYHGGGKPHCGHCLPCIIRRGAFKRAEKVIGADPTPYRTDDLAAMEFDSTRKTGEQFRGFEFATGMLAEKPARAKAYIYKTGPLFEDGDKIDDYADLYLRGMREVADFMKAEGVTTYSSKAGNG